MNGWNATQFSMLGLGDIVIPGLLVALMLRYDYARGLKNSRLVGKKTYFWVCMVGVRTAPTDVCVCVCQLIEFVCIVLCGSADDTSGDACVWCCTGNTRCELNGTSDTVPLLFVGLFVFHLTITVFFLFFSKRFVFFVIFLSSPLSPFLFSFLSSYSLSLSLTFSYPF